MRGPDGVDVIDPGDGHVMRAHVEAGFGPLALWGGVADRRTRRTRNRDTAAVMSSCSKSVLAVSVGRLEARACLLTLALGRVVGA